MKMRLAHKKKGAAIFSFDVMVNDRFICSMKMPYCPLFPLEEKDIKDFILQQKPSLKGKDFNIAF